MALPKLNVPHYETTLPSGKKVSFRPFLVKEEKLLMIAMQSGDASSLLDAAKQVLDNCVGSVSNIAIDKLPIFDIEYLFLQLRARSIGEVVKIKYRCNNPVVVPDEGNTEPKIVPCSTESEYEINLLTIAPTVGEGHTKTIQLTDTVGVTMKYPNFTSLKQLSLKDLEPEEAFRVIAECIESVHDLKNVVYTKDIPIEETLDFLNNLNHGQLAKVDQFFTSMPKIKAAVPFNCPKCGFKETLEVEGIESFFD